MGTQTGGELRPQARDQNAELSSAGHVEARPALPVAPDGQEESQGLEWPPFLVEGLQGAHQGWGPKGGGAICSTESIVGGGSRGPLGRASD